MGKIKTSRKRKGSSPNVSGYDLTGCRVWSPTKEILNVDNLAKAIVECLLNDDPDGVMEVIKIYLETVNRVQIAKKSKLSRATLYKALKHKNPTIKTLAKLIHAAAA